MPETLTAPAVRLTQPPPPDKFLLAYLTNNPRAIQEFEGQPNPERSLADALIAAYRTALVLTSPSFNESYRAQVDPKRAHLIPRAGVLDEMYNAATQKRE